MSKWEAMGYQTENLVEVPGTMSRRGGILDIYPPNSDYPVRLEFFGNTIESLRLFESSTQRSQKVISNISICPATEILPVKITDDFKIRLKEMDLSTCSPEVRDQFKQEFTMILEGQRPANLTFYSALFNSGNIIDYLPENCLVIIDEASRVKEEIEYINKQAEELRIQKIESGELPVNFPRPYFDWKDIEAKIKNLSNLNISSWVGSEESNLIQFNFTTAPDYAGQLPTLLLKSKDLLQQQFRLIIISNQASRLSELV